MIWESAAESPPAGIDARLWRSAMTAPERMVQLQRDGSPVWLKKSAPARGVARYRVLSWISRWLDAPMLEAVPQPGGAPAIATEHRRLVALAAAGVRVPDVIESHRDWLLISDLGESAVTRFRACRGELQALLDLLETILDELDRVHEAGQYLSQGFARNILFPDPGAGSIGFIDFEDDPLAVMPLPMAQARDLLLFAYSACPYFENHSTAFRCAVRGRMEGWPGGILAKVESAVLRLGWLRRLPLNSRLGRDYRRLLSLLDALSPP